MSVRLIFKRDEFDSYTGTVNVTYETVDIECPEITQRMLRGGCGPSGSDTTSFVGIELKETP